MIDSPPAEAQLSRIRDRIERSHALTVKPGESTDDLVYRLTLLAMPENAGRAWFDRWQVERQCTKALRVALAALLTRLDNGDTVEQGLIEEAWAVLRDVKHLMPEPDRSSSGEQPGSPHDSATSGGEPGT